MILNEHQKDKMSDYGIPSYMHGGLVRYYENSILPGSFLEAVINNDLREACARADDTNRHCLFAYTMWFYNEAPSGSWGYAGAVNDWINRGKENDRKNIETVHTA